MDRRRAFPASSSGGFFSIGRLMDTWIFFLFVAIAGEYLSLFVSFSYAVFSFPWGLIPARSRPLFLSLSLSFSVLRHKYIGKLTFLNSWTYLFDNDKI